MKGKVKKSGAKPALKKSGKGSSRRAEPLYAVPDKNRSSIR